LVGFAAGFTATFLAGAFFSFDAAISLSPCCG
jgi:hypothetical protein